MVYCIIPVQNMGFTLVLFPNVTSGKMALTYWKLEKPLLQKTLSVVLFFREYDSTHQQFLTNTNQYENKNKLSSNGTMKLRDSLYRSSEMFNNDTFHNA